MTLFGIILALLNPLFTSVQNVVSKKTLVLDPSKFDWNVVFSRLAYGIPVLAILFYFMPWNAPLVLSFWLLVGLLIILEIPSQWYYHQSIKAGQMSLVMPLTALLSILMLPTIYIFSDWTIGGIIGSIFIALSVYVLSATQTGFSKKNLFAPITHLVTNKPSRYMLIAVGLWGITTPLQKYLVKLSNVPTLGVLYLGGCSICVIIFTVVLGNTKQTVIPANKSVPFIGLLAGIASVTQYWSLLYLHPIYMIALKDTILFWTIIWDIIFFKEKISRAQLIATLCVFSGSMLIVFL